MGSNKHDKKKKLRKKCKRFKIKFLKELGIGDKLTKDVIRAKLKEKQNVDKQIVFPTDPKYFAQIREVYYQHLQRTIQANCKHLSEDMLEKISLALEQNVLISSIQVDVYQEEIIKIMCDIKKATAAQELHHEIQKNLVQDKEIVTKVELAEHNNSTCLHNRKISTLCGGNSKNTLDLAINNHCESDNPASYAMQGQLMDQESHIECSYGVPYEQVEFASDNATPFQFIPTVITSQYSEMHQDMDNSNWVDYPLPSEPCNAISMPPYHNTNRPGQDDEYDLDQIAQILQGEDSLDQKLIEVGEGRTSTPGAQNLNSRLTKMRLIFGCDDDNDDDIIDTNKKRMTQTESQLPPQISTSPKKVSFWKYEKVIHLYKYFQVVKELSWQRRCSKRMQMVDLFGRDSDDEHEEEFCSEEGYATSCKDRMSPWIVKYLMPYYKEGRVVGRTVFKILARHIADTVYAKIQYPDEWTIKYYVSSFFPHKKSYNCETSVRAFHLHEVPELYS